MQDFKNVQEHRINFLTPARNRALLFVCVSYCVRTMHLLCSLFVYSFTNVLFSRSKVQKNAARPCLYTNIAIHNRNNTHCKCLHSLLNALKN